MGQPAEVSQGREHRLEREADSVAESQGCQRIGLVMSPTHLQLVGRHQGIELEGEILFAIFFEQPEALEIRLAESEGPGG